MAYETLHGLISFYLVSLESHHSELPSLCFRHLELLS